MSVTSKLTTLTLTLGMISSVSAADGFDPTKPVMTELKDGVYQYSQFFYNSLVVVTDRCLLYTSPSPRDRQKSRMPSSA